MNDDFWGEPISVYTDADAINDGIIHDVSEFGAEFNDLPVNRATIGVLIAMEMRNKQPVTIKHQLKYITENCRKDREDSDAWGIFEADKRLGNQKLWLIPNEVNGYTIILPNEY